jgi:hypothetical protein
MRNHFVLYIKDMLLVSRLSSGSFPLKTFSFSYANFLEWAQAPVKFEDALGRVIPIPSEYDWDVS